jgi:hypothetical protein
MKNKQTIILMICIILTGTCCIGPNKEVVINADYAIEDVSVISMQSDSISRNKTVFVKGEKIIRIVDSDKIEIGKDVEKIDGVGKYLIPGLAEMHAHLDIPENGNTELLHEMMMMFVANGITTVRGMKGDIYHLTIKSQTASGEVIGPRVFTCGTRLNNTVIKTKEDARRLVKEQFEAGFDFVKIHRRLSPELFHEIADAAYEYNIRIAGHIPETVGLIEALGRNYVTVDHFDGYMQALMPDSFEIVPFEYGELFAAPLSLKVDMSKVDELVQLTKEKGTWVVPTQAWMERLVTPADPQLLISEPGMAYVSKQTRAAWAQHKEQYNQIISEEVAQRYVEIHRILLKKMHDAGVGTLFGADAPQIANVPGFSMHHEVKAYQAAGLSNWDILKMATINPAIFLDKTNTFGSIKEGLEADLVLLDGNPVDDMENLKNPAGVMLRGRWLSQEFLSKELEKIRTKYQ